MRELDVNTALQRSERTEVQVKKKQEKELKLVSSIRPYAGHTLYEINNKTLEVTPAQYKKKEYITWDEALKIYNGNQSRLHTDVIIKQGYTYISALNAKSALKRYIANKGSAEYADFSNVIKL